VHDPVLRDDPGLVAAAGAAARLALENERLHARLRAQLAEVRQSRARIVSAADVERRRIERDLHDGAQQRLVALGLTLKILEKQRALDPEGQRLLASAVDELQGALHELRELARGVHPAVLTERGLEAALQSLASRTPLPVTIAAAPHERLRPDVEAAAYFVACEGVTNAVRYSKATGVTIKAERNNGQLLVEVVDDGVGGATIAEGTGLRGLADRVEAHGGNLLVESPPGGGTRLVGEIPCAS
jgi:signal transduction histidine kinase